VIRGSRNNISQCQRLCGCDCGEWCCVPLNGNIPTFFRRGLNNGLQGYSWQITFSSPLFSLPNGQQNWCDLYLVDVDVDVGVGVGVDVDVDVGVVVDDNDNGGGIMFTSSLFVLLSSSTSFSTTGVLLLQVVLQ